MEPELKNEICAVVVTYHPGEAVRDNVSALLAQVAQVVIVDNAASPESRAVLQPLTVHPNVRTIWNDRNLGIAAALNQGVRCAREQGFGWIATFDQDSRVPPDYFEALRRTYDSLPQRDRVAIISPLLRDLDIRTLHSFTHEPLAYDQKDFSPWALVPVTITSGNLIPAKVFDAVGPYREDFFIDYVDLEFCLRCRRDGWLILESRHAVLDHKFGQPTRHRFLWRRPVVFNHGHLRRYYGWRNRLVVYANYARFDPRWVVHDLRLGLREIVLTVLFENDVLRKMRYAIHGLWHGMIGRMGPCPD